MSGVGGFDHRHGAEHRVQPDAGTDERRRRLRPSPRRHDEAPLLDEVRRAEREHASLAQALADDAELVVLEVPDPAVDQLRRGRARAAAEVALLDEHRAQAAAGRLAGDVHARDAAAHHRHVEVGVES